VRNYVGRALQHAVNRRVYKDDFRRGEISECGQSCRSRGQRVGFGYRGLSQKTIAADPATAVVWRISQRVFFLGAGEPRFVCAIKRLMWPSSGSGQPVAVPEGVSVCAARLPGSTPSILMSWYCGGRLGIYGYPAAARVSSTPALANQSAMIGRAGLKRRRRRSPIVAKLSSMRVGCEPELRQPMRRPPLSPAARYTSVLSDSTHAPSVSFAGSILLSPMMCITGTPCANR
jgi:hypothetical protein